MGRPFITENEILLGDMLNSNTEYERLKHEYYSLLLEADKNYNEKIREKYINVANKIIDMRKEYCSQNGYRYVEDPYKAPVKRKINVLDIITVILKSIGISILVYIPINMFKPTFAYYYRTVCLTIPFIISFIILFMRKRHVLDNITKQDYLVKYNYGWCARQMTSSEIADRERQREEKRMQEEEKEAERARHREIVMEQNVKDALHNYQTHMMHARMSQGVDRQRNLDYAQEDLAKIIANKK